MTQLVKIPTTHETWVWFLGWEDPLEKGTVNHSSILAWSCKELDMTEQLSQLSLWSNSHLTNGKAIALTTWTFVSKVMSLLFNVLSRFVIAFLPRSKWLLISWLQSPSTVILEHKKIKYLTVSIVSPSICHEMMGSDAMILVFWMLSFKPAFSLFYFNFIMRLFSSSSLASIRWYHLHIWGWWYFSWDSWFQLVLPPAQHFTWCALHIS